MKKMIIILAMLTLVGCGSKEPPKQETFAHSFVETIEVEKIEVETIEIK